MEITEVTISIRNDEKLRGFANITLDDMFVVRGLKIIRGIGKYFVAMPSRKNYDGTFKDVAHPINHQFRDEMEKVILEKYWEKLGRLSD